MNLDNIRIDYVPESPVLPFEEFDLTPHIDALRTGQNVLAIRGLNISAGDEDFIMACRLTAFDAGTVQAGHDGTDGDLESLGDFFVRQVMVIAQHDDLVAFDNRRQSMSNDERRTAFRYNIQRILNFLLSCCIKRRGGFIQDQYGRRFEDGAGNRYPLFFAA